MALKQKSSSRVGNISTGLMIGWIVQIILTVMLCLLLAALIISGRAGWGVISYSVPTIIAVCAYAGAAASCKLTEHHKLAVCLSSAALYLGTLLAIAVLFFDKKPSAFWVSTLVALGGATASLLVNIAPKKRIDGRLKNRRR